MATNMESNKRLKRYACLIRSRTPSETVITNSCASAMTGIKAHHSRFKRASRSLWRNHLLESSAKYRIPIVRTTQRFLGRIAERIELHIAQLLQIGRAHV